MPDIPPGKLRALLEQLHYHYRRAGMPGVRRIAKETRFSHTAVHGLLTQARTQPPNQEILFDVVQALLVMRPRGIDEKEREDTLDWFDAAWMAALDHPFDAIAAQEGSAEAKEMWLRNVREALRDETASNNAPNERWRVLASSADDDHAPDLLSELLTALQWSVEAGRSEQDESPSTKVTRKDPRPVVHTPITVARGDEAVAAVHARSIDRSRELFPFLSVAETRTPRYRRVEFRLPSTDEVDEPLIFVMEDLAHVLFITEESDYEEDEDGDADEGQWLLKLYVVVRDWSDVDFYRAVEELAAMHDVQLAGLKHVTTPTDLEAGVLARFAKMDDDEVVATHAEITLREARTIRAEAPKKLKVRTFEQALVDAERFGIIPSDEPPLPQPRRPS